MSGIKAIETRYKGYRFRSRLEARWAVFFDAEGLEWQYEREGFDLDSGILYLPDFWLPQVRMWAEVKHDRFTPEESEKAWRLFAHTGRPVIFLIGPPSVAAYKFTCFLNEIMFCPCSSRCVDCRRAFNDCFVSSYHDYPRTEGRFYTNTGESNPEDEMPTVFRDDWPGLGESVTAARSARFEHGESP